VIVSGTVSLEDGKNEHILSLYKDPPMTPNYNERLFDKHRIRIKEIKLIPASS